MKDPRSPMSPAMIPPDLSVLADSSAVAGLSGEAPGRADGRQHRLAVKNTHYNPMRPAIRCPFSLSAARLVTDRGSFSREPLKAADGPQTEEQLDLWSEDMLHAVVCGHVDRARGETTTDPRFPYLPLHLCVCSFDSRRLMEDRGGFLSELLKTSDRSTKTFGPAGCEKRSPCRNAYHHSHRRSSSCRVCRLDAASGASLAGRPTSRTGNSGRS